MVVGIPVRIASASERPASEPRRGGKTTGRWWSPTGRNPCIIVVQPNEAPTDARTKQALKGQQTKGRWWSDSGTPVKGNAPIKWSPERATECGQIAQPRTAGKSGARGNGEKWIEMERNGEKWRVHAAGGTWRAIDGVRHPYGVPRPRWFRVTGVPLPLHHLPVILSPLRGSAAQFKRQSLSNLNGNCRLT